MIAALAVWGMATKWPDLLVAAIMASLFLTSSIQILRQSFKEMRMEVSCQPSNILIRAGQNPTPTIIKPTLV
jgi:Co/Zn/Cd efflux system component